MARSHEDVAGEFWPASPPYQQLDACELAGERHGLVAVGMAGRSHWSLALEAEGDVLWFDVACRLQQTGGDLRSTYTLSWPFRLSENREQQPDNTAVREVRWRQQPEDLDCQLLIHWDCRTTRVRTASNQQQLVVEPVEAKGAVPCTTRWRYGFELTPGPVGDPRPK